MGWLLKSLLHTSELSVKPADLVLQVLGLVEKLKVLLLRGLDLHLHVAKELTKVALQLSLGFDYSCNNNVLQLSRQVQSVDGFHPSRGFVVSEIAAGCFVVSV